MCFWSSFLFLSVFVKKNTFFVFVHEIKHRSDPWRMPRLIFLRFLMSFFVRSMFQVEISDLFPPTNKQHKKMTERVLFENVKNVFFLFLGKTGKTKTTTVEHGWNNNSCQSGCVDVWMHVVLVKQNINNG